MKLNISKTIDENIIGVDISVAELGTSDTDASTEKDMLHNFVRTIEYSKISFKSNMKVDSNGDPVTTDSEVDGSTIISVELKDIISQSFVVDENLHITFSIDVTKIPESEVKAPFDSVEKLGKAKVELFATKIQEEIGKKLAEIRALNTKFEGETEVILQLLRRVAPTTLSTLGVKFGSEIKLLHDYHMWFDSTRILKIAV